jgi:hypothetical protein
VRDAGFDVLEETATGLPLGAVVSDGGLASIARRVDELLVKLRPTLFGYQYVLRLTAHAEETLHSDDLLGLRSDEIHEDLPSTAQA